LNQAQEDYADYDIDAEMSSLKLVGFALFVGLSALAIALYGWLSYSLPGVIG